MFKNPGLLFKIIIWVFVIFNFCLFITNATNNKLSLKPIWLSSNPELMASTYCSNLSSEILKPDSYCMPVKYKGFPIQIGGSVDKGHFWLSWFLNYILAGIFAVSLGWLLLKKQIIGLILCAFFRAVFYDYYFLAP